MIFMLSYLNSNLALTPGYLNPALNNSALVYILRTGFFVTDYLHKPWFKLQSVSFQREFPSRDLST